MSVTLIAFSYSDLGDAPRAIPPHFQRR